MPFIQGVFTIEKLKFVYLWDNLVQE
jgi:hypothetical protein